ncbi:hypothetical protein BH11CYA1_BH11CYA1_23290 [soil metagenome]
MQYMRICSRASLPGHIVSKASMPRVFFSQTVGLKPGDSEVLFKYRTALAARHLGEHLQVAKNGTYFSSLGINLWELILQSCASEQYISGESVVALIDDIGRRLKQDGLPPLEGESTRHCLRDLSLPQLAVIREALVASSFTLSELTTAEKRMTWLGHPEWLAEDSTTAVSLRALLMARRSKSNQFS